MTAKVKAHHAKHTAHAKAAAKLPGAAELQKEIRALQSEVAHIKHPSGADKAKAKEKHKATAGAKHKTTSKHHAAKKRTLTPGDIGCCMVEALAMSLRLQGFRVTGDDVLDLFWRAGGDVDEGLPIAAGLEAAQRFGLAGVRPSWRELDGAQDGPAPRAAGGLGYPGRLRGGYRPDGHLGDRDLLIIGVELPGPHTLLAANGRLWSWGEPFDPAAWPDAVIEEAWAISWGLAA